MFVFVTGILLFYFGKVRETEYFAARRNTENRLRRLSESNLISICYWKRTGEITDANDAFLLLLGYTRSDLINRKLNWHDLAPAGKVDCDRNVLTQSLEVGKHITFRKDFIRKDKTSVPVIVGAAFLDSAKRLGIAYLLDMTELRDAEERGNELKQKLQQAQRLEAVGQLASGIAHDFNNLLNIINGYAFLIEQRSEPESSSSTDARHILRAAERAAGLVRKLLAFARKQLLRPRVLSINSTLQEYADLLPILVGAAIRVEFTLDPELWLVEVDPSQLEQVIINLAINARDAMPSGGSLIISTANDKGTGRVILKVSDTGIGMDEETRARIFDPFFTTKPKGQGTGLGLSTVYGIIKQSGGEIVVRSELQHGTTFTIYLPKADGSQKEDISVEQTLTPFLVGKQDTTILLVEDEPDLRELLVSMLRKNGYKVLAAEDGEEAVVVAKNYEGVIDLLVTDIVMPHMNGIEAAKQIHAVCPTMRVIYMTGYAEAALSMHRTAANEMLLEKPVSPPILLEKISGILKRGVPDRHTA